MNFNAAHRCAVLLGAWLLSACNSEPPRAEQQPRPRGRIYSAEDVQREATELLAREVEARARHRALFELRARLTARGAELEPLPNSPGLPNDRHRPTHGLSEEALAQMMARLRQANTDFERYVPRLDRLRQKFLQASKDLGGEGIAEQLDRIELAGSGALQFEHQGHAIALELIFIPAGRSAIGINLEDPDLPEPLLRRGLARVIASPAVEVIQTEGFFMQRDELSNAERALLEGAAPTPTDRAAYPATDFSWRVAMQIAARVEQEAFRLRLPSEVEWEYAARYAQKGEPRFYPWGDTQTSSQIAALHAQVSPVAEAGVDRSFLGLRNLAGNVREWTLDAWRERRWEALAPRSIHHASRVEIPAPDSLPSAVTVRGAYAGDAHALHYEAAWREGVAPESQAPNLGARFVVIRRGN